MTPFPIEILATAFFVLAVLHTFMVQRFASLAHRHPKGSFKGTMMHFLAETEVVFGLWAAALFLGVAVLQQSVPKAVAYVEGLNFTEPKFVFVVMVVAATRPVVQLAEKIISGMARLLPLQESLGFYVSALTVGPLLGSFITEPAAMTLLALLLKRRYFDQGISPRLAYATLGLLFVNISIGGTLTHFAAPPVLMVAAKWGWGTPFMLEHFGILVIFLGLVTATSQYQDQLKFREGLLVGFFLAGLVVMGSLQAWWLQPLLTRLDGANLFFGATALTAITDNAALTYLGTLVEGLTTDQKYALVAGAVTGGGLTVIANAPNPAGVGILHSSKVFNGSISPLGLFLGALFPTGVAVIFFWLVR